MEKVHAAVAEAHLEVEKCQNTPGSDDSWKLRCRKNARHCGVARSTFGSQTRQKLRVLGLF